MRLCTSLLAMVVLALGLAAVPPSLTSRVSDTDDFVHFESAHVHPLVMTPSTERLLAVNTPDNRLAVFDLTGSAPVRLAEIPVGMEPVSVAALSDSEAWVVNQLSDDISIVNLNTGHVSATLRVGDEPSDVVFARGKAYVSVSQEDAVKIYDATTRAQIGTVAIQGRMPRALAATGDGNRVYVAVFHAGNRTSVLSQADVTRSNGSSGAPPPNPPLRPGLPPPPVTGLIVQQQGSQWVDEAGQVWSSNQNPTGQRKIFYDVLDTDLVEIATANDQVARTYSGLGSLQFGLAASPADGRIAVTTTEARNLTRFEPNLRGHMVDTRAAVIVPGGGAPTLVNLNPSINYSVSPGPVSDHDVALGIPTGVGWALDGQRLYVTALANDRIAELSVTSTPAILNRTTTVGGPTGVVVDGLRERIYVLGRYRNELQTLELQTLSELARSGLGFDPTPDRIVNGRKFFYGGFTSGHGDQACATCHVFGDFDNLAWDLGNPQGDMQPIDRNGQVDPAIDSQVHPMKGPMTTQSLRGLPNTGMFHWRADRLDLNAFNAAFVGLMGRATALPDSEMAAFNDFVLPLAYPPNPNQFIDRTFRTAPLHQPSAERGRDFFMNRTTDAIFTCNNCHTATAFGPGTNGQIINNQALAESQDMKVPQLRNMYKKTGFTDAPGAVNKRGFGFIHDGSVDNLFNFLQFPGFNFNQPNTQTPDENRRDVEAFLLSYDTGIAPSVGFQITFHGANNNEAQAVARLDTLRAQWQAGHCEVVAKGRVAGRPRGWWYQGNDTWMSDRGGESIQTTNLRALGGPGSEVTVLGVPPGLGRRMGVDRDRDSYLDFDELLAGSDPGNPASTPLNVGVPGRGASASDFRALRPNPFRSATEVTFALVRAGRVDCVIHDVLGRRVRSLAEGVQLAAGPQSLRWDGRRDDGGEVSGGVYFVRLSTPDGSWTRPVVRVR
jgi:YVTN family beta-propeller protein